MQKPPRLPPNYRAMRLLGEGHRGRVWLVEDLETSGVTLALKEFDDAATQQIALRREQLAKLPRLRHPNLVEIFSSDTNPETGSWFVTTEPIDGAGIVEAVAEEGKNGWLGLAVEALRGLAFLHEFGVIHGAIKPGNLLVRSESRLGSRVVLLDYGMTESLTAASNAALPYLAPERLAGGEPTIGSDLYALGAILFEAIHARPPIERKDDELADFIERVRSGRRARTPLPDGYAAEIQRWLDAMLSPDPARRPATAAAALKRLGAASGETFASETDAGSAARRLANSLIDDAADPSETPVAAETTDRRMAALYRMIRQLNSQTDPDSILESILDMALQVVRAERGMILLRETPEGAFNVRLARNLEQETIADAQRFSRSIVEQAGQGQAVLSLDARNDSRFHDLKSVSLYGIHALMCVPLRVDGEIVGAVYVDSKEDGLFTPDDLRFLQAFAEHAALALSNARRRAALLEDTQRLQLAAEERASRGNQIGGSEPMQQVFALIDKVAASELPVLIQGESGTGKELVAQAIHYDGARKKRAFIGENCAAIPDTLLQSELFGHVRGAFTGADRDRAGLFEQAHEGTLFLDEVGDMSPTMQAQLLRALQEGEIRRVGGTQPIRVDVRVIAATHRDLHAEAAAGRFREDLLYRLAVLLIALPPLRARPGDVRLLTEHFLRRIAAARSRPVPAIEGRLLERLERYPWPGNVRQLENTLQRLSLLAGDGPLGLDLLALDPGLRRALEIGDSEPASAAPLSLSSSERGRIVEALRTAGGNRSRAARLLGISRATIYRKIKFYKVDEQTL